MNILEIGNFLDADYAGVMGTEAENRLGKTNPKVYSAAERESIIDGIYDGTTNADNPDPRLVSKTRDFLERRLQIGFGRSYTDQLEAADSKTLQGLRDNLDEFARAKARVQTKALREQMFSNGVKRSRDAIKGDTKKVFDKYNESYLKAEGNVTEKQTRISRKVQQMKKKGAKYLRYTAVLDSRTRPNHRALDSVIKPIDDDFWNSNLPPRGYNCRCDVVQVSGPGVGRPKENLPGPDAGQKEIFSRNPVKSRKIFPKTKHPYFKS